MELSRNNIIMAVLLILIYVAFASLFAAEDNNNPIVLPKEGIIRPTYNIENYSDLPDYSENFLWDQTWMGNTNKDCYKLNKNDCMKYANCGLCTSGNDAVCVPGDQQGPMFKEGCDQWIHTDYRDRHMFGEKVMTVSPPHDYQYPDYEAWYPSPISRARL